METIRSSVQMESVFVYLDVALGSMIVVIIQMNSSAVSVLFLLLLALVCSPTVPFD